MPVAWMLTGLAAKEAGEAERAPAAVDAARRLQKGLCHPLGALRIARQQHGCGIIALGCLVVRRHGMLPKTRRPFRLQSWQLTSMRKRRLRSSSGDVTGSGRAFGTA